MHESMGQRGGVSTLYPRPNWQKANGVENKYGPDKRQVPDVSAWAIEIPTYNKGEWISNSGTSFAAPIWTAGMALVNQGTIAQAKTYFNGPEIFYNVANNPHGKTPFYDVVKGSNLYYSATRGWDDRPAWGHQISWISWTL
jgi:kumamolisin